MLRSTLSTTLLCSLALVACGGTAVGSVSASGGASVAPKPSGALDHFRLSLSSWSAVYDPFFIAVDKGYAAAQGLDVEFVIAPGGMAVPALISGEMPYTASAASAMGAIIKGAPLKVIYTNADRSVQQLWAAPEIKSLDDLKGKTIGVASRGDSNEITVRILLTQQHIDQSTISFTALGSNDVGMTALQTGAVPVAVIGASFVGQLQKSGYKGHLLYDLSKVQLLYNGLATSDKEIAEHRERAKRLLYATMQGRAYMKAFRAEALRSLTDRSKQSSDDAAADFDTTLAAMTEDGTMPVQAQRDDSLVRASLIQMAASEVPPPDKLYDYSMLQQANQELQASGWKPQR